MQVGDKVRVLKYRGLSRIEGYTGTIVKLYGQREARVELDPEGLSDHIRRVNELPPRGFVVRLSEVELLAPATEPERSPVVSVKVRPCPCATSSDPGHTVGYFGDRVTCYTCRGTLYVVDDPRKVSVVAVETACRTWPLDDNEPPLRGDKVALALNKASEPFVYGSMVQDFNPANKSTRILIEHVGGDPYHRIGSVDGWQTEYLLRWNGVKP